MLSEKETEEDYKKAMKILQGQENKVKKLKEKYLSSDSFLTTALE